MPADSKHKDFERYQSLYSKIKDCKEGEGAIKAAGENYLPRLSGQDVSAYDRYKKRGAFLNATGRTINALTGLMLRKEPVVEVPQNIEEDMESITSNNLSIYELIRDCCEASLSFARQGLLIDADENGDEVFIAVYDALSIINWRTRMYEGEEILTMLCLQETATKISEEDQFHTEYVDQVRVLQLEAGDDEEEGELGKLVVRLYQKQEDNNNKWIQVGEDIMPQVMGARLDRIPFVIIGAIANEISPEKPILADLATLNIGHWRLEVDYKHGLHLCALPTPWAAGFPKEAELYIGPEKAWVSEEPQAQAGYLEFTGRGLEAIEKALQRTENQMAVMGSRILENQKKDTEAYQTVKARSGSDTATLSNIAATVEKGIEHALQWFARWKGKDDAEVNINLTRDFIDADIDPQLLNALLQAVQAGKMSIDTFLWNLKKGELIPPDKTVEDERQEIEEEDEANLERDMEKFEAMQNLKVKPDKGEKVGGENTDEEDEDDSA